MIIVFLTRVLEFWWYIGHESKLVINFFISFFLFSFLETKVADVLVEGKPLSRGTDEKMVYAKFELHKSFFLNITTIGLDHVVEGRECGFACVNIPSCFSFNLAAFHDIKGTILCELLPSDIYNNSDKLIPSQSHHHYSIAVSCKRKLFTLFYWKEEEMNYTRLNAYG